MRLSAGLTPARLLTVAFSLFLAAWMLGLAGPDTSRALAQPPDPPVGGEAEPEKPTTTTKKADAEEKGLLEHMVDSVGPVFGPLLVFISVSLIAVRMLDPNAGTKCFSMSRFTSAFTRARLSA